MLSSIVLMAIGLSLLLLAADRLVVAVVNLSRRFGVSAILIGAVVVGLGTSVPELLVSTLAAAGDNPDVAMANVVGSNIANVTLVLGAATLVAPIRAQLKTLKREGFLMLVSVVALFVVLIDKDVTRWEGVALLVGLVVAFGLLIRWSITDAEHEDRVEHEVEHSVEGCRRVLLGHFLAAIASLVATIFASDLLLDATLDIGERLELSPAFLGVILGVGTSLPELATATASMRRGQSDLVVGNVLGSNLFNSLAVAGSAAAVRGGTLVALGPVSLWIMVSAVFIAGIMSRTGLRITRYEGLLLIAGFALFTATVY